MRLQAVRFGAFKSLYDVRADFDRLTVITGPNGAGKSNLADGLAFISEAYKNGLEIAVARSGGYDNIAYRKMGRARAPVTVEVTINFDEPDIPVTHPPRQRANRRQNLEHFEPPFQLRHRFSFRAEGQALASDFRVAEDEIRISDRLGDLLYIGRESDAVNMVAFDRLEEAGRSGNRLAEDLGYLLTKDDFVRHLFQSRQLSRTELFIPQLRPFSSLPAILGRLGQIKVYQLSPHQSRKTGVPTPNASLSRYGENLPAVADHLRKHRSESWHQIEEAMRAIVPNLVEIETRHTEDRLLALQFRESGVRRAWNASEMSDGTIQALALFTAIIDGRSPLLFIEEPENSLHPWILRQFVDLCRSQDQNQIVLTTHSPIVIDYMDPSHLRLMWQQRGRSKYATWNTLDPALSEAWKLGDIKAFEAYDAGAFVEGVPHGLMPGEDRREIGTWE